MKKLQKLLRRKDDSNKGDFGHVLIISGDHGMGGAMILAAEAACRTGAGKVSVLSRKENYSAVLSRLPNVVTIAKDADLKNIFANKTVIVIGPGLGKSSWATRLLKLVLTCELPKIIDADALNLISEMKKIPQLQNSILTPHVGEAARLLSCTTSVIQKNREVAAKKLHEKFGSIVILKGNGSLICGDNFLQKCKFGNPGMAVAGMGDVLSGVIGGLVAQKLNLKDAAIFGVEIHAKAGDLAAKKQGEIGIMPQDLFSYVEQIINKA